jgi:hypothetical protein
MCADGPTANRRIVNSEHYSFRHVHCNSSGVCMGADRLEDLDSPKARSRPTRCCPWLSAGDRLDYMAPGWSGPVRSRSLRRSGPPRPGTGSAGRARQGRCKPRPTDHLVPKPDRAGSLPAKASYSAGRGRCGVVRGCPFGTGQDCCEWHDRATAVEMTRYPVAPLVLSSASWLGPSSATTASLASRERGAAAFSQLKVHLASGQDSPGSKAKALLSG